jgi:(heptosyl)LPS beta-1,4-glucosyltransferase
VGETLDNAEADAVGISVCIVCRNEAQKLGDCLDSVSWAGEVIVMDLSSDDESAAVAEAHGAHVITREPYPIVEPLRNELAALAHGAWVLALDPDERISPALGAVLAELARRDDLDAVIIPRMNWDLGYPPSDPIQRYEPQLRMYRPSRVKWPVVPNALPTVDEQRKYRLPQNDEWVIIHDRSRNIPEVLDRVIRYAPAQAQSMQDQGQLFSAKDMLLALATQVDKEFFRSHAWRDGVPGVLRAGILVAYKFYVWAAFWQLSGAKRTQADDQLVQRIGMILAGLRRLLALSGACLRFARRLVGGLRG